MNNLDVCAVVEQFERDGFLLSNEYRAESAIPVKQSRETDKNGKLRSKRNRDLHAIETRVNAMIELINGNAVKGY